MYLVVGPIFVFSDPDILPGPTYTMKSTYMFLLKGIAGLSEHSLAKIVHAAGSAAPFCQRSRASHGNRNALAAPLKSVTTTLENCSISKPRAYRKMITLEHRIVLSRAACRTAQTIANGN
nr:hypothetical protein CFP56_70978 [Quercus suber]